MENNQFIHKRFIVTGFNEDETLYFEILHLWDNFSLKNCLAFLKSYTKGDIENCLY